LFRYSDDNDSPALRGDRAGFAAIMRYCIPFPLVRFPMLPPVFTLPSNTALLIIAATHLPGVTLLAPV